MQYKKQIINIYIIINYLDLKNIYIFEKIDKNIVN